VHEVRFRAENKILRDMKESAGKTKGYEQMRLVRKTCTPPCAPYIAAQCTSNRQIDRNDARA
jgi:hypothetical protein